MGKRKSPGDDDSASQTPYSQFIKRSWEKTDKKGDYDAFVKSCEVKWAEMTDNEKQVYTDGPSESKKRKETKKDSKPKVKKSKDPSKKKKPRGPYIIYCAEIRNEIKVSNPDLTMTQISKELGKRWNALSEAEKHKYQTMANEEKQRYLDEIKNEAN